MPPAIHSRMQASAVGDRLFERLRLRRREQRLASHQRGRPAAAMAAEIAPCGGSCRAMAEPHVMRNLAQTSAADIHEAGLCD